MKCSLSAAALSDAWLRLEMLPIGIRSLEGSDRDVVTQRKPVSGCRPSSSAQFTLRISVVLNRHILFKKLFAYAVLPHL